MNQLLVRFLGVQSDDPLLERYAQAVERCRPPIHLLGERSHGLAVLRWLLHRVLPHRCFLVDTLHLAARFAVTVDSLAAVVAGDTQFARSLRHYEYGGPLRDFDGRRWWIDGIEQWLWEITNEDSDDNLAVHAALQALGGQFQRIEIKRPVVTLDVDFRPEKEFAEFDDVVAVNLDDWPSYAEPAYMRVSTIKDNSHLRMYVDTRDRPRLLQ